MRSMLDNELLERINKLTKIGSPRQIRWQGDHIGPIGNQAVIGSQQGHNDTADELYFRLIDARANSGGFIGCHGYLFPLKIKKTRVLKSKLSQLSINTQVKLMTERNASELYVNQLQIEQRVCIQAALQVLIDELIRTNLMTPERLADAFQVRSDTHRSHEQTESGNFLEALALYSASFDARELGYRK